MCCNQSPLCTGSLCVGVETSFTPFRSAFQPPVFLQKLCQHFNFFFNFWREGRGWGKGEAAVISTEAGLVLRGIRDTQVFSQRALCRALLEPSSIPVCQTTLSRGVRYPEPVSNAKSSNRGKKKKKSKGREEGRRGMWGKRKGGKCSSSKKKVVVPTWLFLFKIIS